ncbi:MAG: class I SAM-dependent rRNA methyltransferase [Erysipelotrichaceae bacterium]|nr:class I SAM-dependent rRNA methyltransferase [Erysipelotrichaceae bacterium]
MSTIVTLKKGEGRTVKRGGLWIYDNEISTIKGRFHNGDIVSVVDDRGHFIGQGYINQNSKIRIRLLSRHEDDVLDDVFFARLLQRAWDYRKKVVDTGSCRVVFGEADGLPGLVIDKFEDVLVIQSLTLGMDRLKEQVVRLMKDILEKDGIVVKGIYERSDAKERTKEGLERVKGFLSEPFDTKFIIEENGVRYEIDVENGQKTGYFLDQKYNRLAIQSLCQDADVLDCFTYIGSFALNAAKGGAHKVLGVDASDLAVELATRNAVLNGVEDHVSFEAHDLFDFLPELEDKGCSFDVVILDPPAFTKSRSSIKNAMKGYREINMRGMRLIKDGGYLATCTCSHFMDDEHFRQAIEQAARLAHKRLRQIEFRQQSPDHPIVWGMGESSYLKFYIFQVFDY